jgi:hypothetical protein
MNAYVSELACEPGCGCGVSDPTASEMEHLQDHGDIESRGAAEPRLTALPRDLQIDLRARPIGGRCAFPWLGGRELRVQLDLSQYLDDLSNDTVGVVAGDGVPPLEGLLRRARRES